MEEECRAAFAKMRLELDALDSVAAVSCDACGQAWECHYEDVCLVPVPEWYKERRRKQEEEEEEEDTQYATTKPPRAKEKEDDRENDEKNVNDDEVDFSDQSAWCQKCFQQLSRHNQSVCETSQELANSVTFKGTTGGRPKESLDDWTRRRRRSLAKGRARGRP